MQKELKMFKVLSNDTRLRILGLLSKKEFCVYQLEWVLKEIQAKISRHLTVLKNAGIVIDRDKGVWNFYSITKPKNNLERAIPQFLNSPFYKLKSF